MRSAWYNGIPDTKTARLVVELSSADACYSREEDTIWVRLGEGNLTDTDNLDPVRWPIWRVQLIHEMLHEFQYKVVGAAVSAAGRNLCQQHQDKFFGPGHDEAFFTAIAKVAPCFQLTPEQLIKWI